MGTYDINYDDKRFTDVENDKQEALTDLENTYGGMIDASDDYYNAQIDASKEWAETQKENQQAQTDFAIQEINQQKDQAQKDYTKEQSGAYQDWQKQRNPYGANAEIQAASGLSNTGYSESSQTAMYVAYQNRVATARESYQRAVLNYDNAITEARLQNNSVLAEIAHTALQQQLELSLAGFQYKNTLILEKANQKQNVENTYYQRYQDVLAQINHENALAEEVRQYNETLAEQQRQHNEEMAYKNAALAEEKRQYDTTLAWQKEQANKNNSGGGGGSGGRVKGSSSGSRRNSISAKNSINKGAKIKATQNAGNKTDSNESTKSEPTVDMSSVLALGYGPINASRLNQLVKEGKVIEYEENGKLKYIKVFND